MNLKYKALLLIPLLVSIDLISKLFGKNINQEIIPNFFYLTTSRNPGVIFGFFSNNLIVTVLLPLALVLLLAVQLKKEKNKTTIYGLILIISGLTGNLLDRLFYGEVIDFIYFKFFPKYSISLFNLADAFVVTGIIFIIYAMYKESNH